MRLVLPALLLAPALLPADPQPQPAAPAARPAPAPAVLPQDPAAEAQEHFDLARKLLGEGKADEARAEGFAGLAHQPYSTAGYQLMLEIADARRDLDDEIRWAKWLSWSHRYSGRDAEATAAAAVLDELTDIGRLDEPVLDAWSASTLKAAQSAAKDKQYRLAGHLYQKVLALRQGDERLLKDYDRLVDKAGEQLSGGSFVAGAVRRRSPEWLAKQNEKHATWDKAYERRTEHFQIKTTISYEFFETVSVVMEDMFDFYQEVYDYKKKAGRMTLALHNSRKDFDEFNHLEVGGSLPLGVRGWFFDQELLVSGYIDDELSPPVTEGDLLSTLFHECSHYFMHLLTQRAGDPPTWLNEGTASYFEGCELKADGSIVKNKPAMNRVRSWEYLENSDQKLSLRQLVSYHQPGSYPGSYYPYGWSFVYFLLNYEEGDPRLTGAEPTPGPDGKPVLPVGKLVYREPYLAYMDSYTKKQKRGGEDSYERCVRIFVDEVGDPEVPDWAAFEDRWRRFIQAVVRESKAGPELADTLQARCRGYLAAGDHERALIAAEQADDKRPQDAETYRLLALAHTGLGNEADAAYWMLRHWEQALAGDDDEALDAAEAWLLEQGAKDLVSDYCAPTRAALVDTLAVMERAMDEDFPLLGQLFAAHYERATGIAPESLRRRADELEDESAQHLRLWQRAFPAGSVPTRQGRIDQERDASVLVFSPENANRTPVWVREANLRWLHPPFAVRGSVQIDGKSEAEVWLGRDSSGQPQHAVAIENGAQLRLVDVLQNTEIEGISGVTVFTTTERHSIKPAQFFHFLLEADRGGGGKMTVNEEAAIRFPADWTAESLSGDLAFAVGSNTAALFRDCEVLPGAAFWPVAPRTDDSGD